MDTIMNAAEVVRRLHEHRAWVNRQLLAAAGPLAPEQLRRGFPIGQGSIWNSLVHLYAAEYVWLEALRGDEAPLAPGDLPNQLPGNQQGESPIASLAELEARWNELDGRWQAYLATLTDLELDRPVTKVNNRGQRFTTRRADTLLHVCTHAQYTAAQVVNMLRHCGAAPLPDVMLISLARQQAAGD